MEKLDNLLKSKGNATRNIFVLYGIGGAGKTSIAYKFAHGQANIPFRVRIRARTFELMQKDFERVAMLMKIDTAGKDFDDIRALVYQKLMSDYKKAIIIFDDVASYSDPFPSPMREPGRGILEYLPQQSKKEFYILITTRSKQGWDKCQKEEIGELKEDYTR